MNKKIKLAVYSVNPVQYHAPIFRALNKEKDVDTTILFGSDIGSRAFYSRELRTTIEWDIPILKGYQYKFFKNLASENRRGTFSRINFGMFVDILKNRYDAVLIHGYDTISSWIVFLAAKLIGAKIIWRGEATIRPVLRQNPIKKFIKHKVLPFYFKKCDAVMYSCTGNRKYIQQFSVKDEKMFLIPCAVDNSFFRERRIIDQNELLLKRQELGILEDDFVVLFSARFTIRKRPLDLIEAVSAIDNKNIVMLFVGEGLERENMEALCEKYNIKSVFTGFSGQKELPKYYSISDLFAVVSDYDASPKSLNEALNFELPVLVTDKVGTSFDLVKDFKNGFIVESRDVKLMSEKIDYLNKNRIIAKEMGKKSLPVSNDWTIENDVKGIMQALNYVLESRS